MGRRRKPKDMQKAHLTQAEKERREEEERTVSTGNEQLKTPPEWLFNRTAKAEWRRITKRTTEDRSSRKIWIKAKFGGVL